MIRKLESKSLDQLLKTLRTLQGEITTHVDLEDDARVDDLSREYEMARDLLLEFQPSDYDSFCKKYDFLELILIQSQEQPELVKRIFDVIRKDVKVLSQP